MVLETTTITGPRGRIPGRLSALAVGRLTEPGLYADGGGLYLQVSKAGSRSWIFRYRFNGRKTPRDMGLGPLHTVSLAEAREKARAARSQLIDGRDPIEARRSTRAQQAAEATRAMTFRDCAAAYIEAHAPGWRNEKHQEQWSSTLEDYAYPILGPIPVHAIDVNLVDKVLRPIWYTKTETAMRLRGRIEAVLDWADVRSFRHGPNPAKWQGRLDRLFPARSRLAEVRHHPALPIDEMGTFMAELRAQGGIAARALEFLILTAARTGEVTGATRHEIDRKTSVWTVPAARMKAGNEHCVPLSARALEILDEVAPLSDGFIFPGGRRGQPLSDNAFRALLRRMDRTDLTPHGFRSTFRDWAAERPGHQAEVAEMALAHVVPSSVVRAYRRSVLFRRRIGMMEAWGRFCGTHTKTSSSCPKSNAAASSSNLD